MKRKINESLIGLYDIIIYSIMEKCKGIDQMADSGILDNKDRGSVGEYLKENIEYGSKLSIISAYFTIYAYYALKERLDHISEMKFLFGEPTFLKNENIQKLREFTIGESIQTNVDMEKREDNVLDYNYDIRLKDKLEQSFIAKECAKWIAERVQIKSMIKPNFLHGKLYHIENLNTVEKSVMGSSNFTVSGLGLGKNKNIELNLITDSNRDIRDLKKWFNEIWNNEDLVQDVKDEVIKFIQQMYKENSPENIYYVTIYNIFKDFLKEQENEDEFQRKVGFKETKVWNMLYDFQKDGVRGVINKLEKHGGCILADSVGLGKTFEALAVIKYYEKKGKKVLVLAPKKLRDNWLLYRSPDCRNILLDDDFKYIVMNHTDLSRSSGKSGDFEISTFEWSIYDLIVIDESHNFRNGIGSNKNESRYSKLLNEVINKGGDKKILMLSATPVNNSLRDLKNQIYLITGGRDNTLYEKTGVKNIQATLRLAQQEFNRWYQTNEKSKEQLMQFVNKDFFKLLDELTIARSRKHINKYYTQNTQIKFPERLRPVSIYPEIDLNGEFLKYDEIDHIIEKLKLSIFYPSHYIQDSMKAKYKEVYDTQLRFGTRFSQEERESHLVGMMKIIYLKRLESSINSFAVSIGKLISKIDNIIEKIYRINSSNEKQEEFELENLEDLEDDNIQDLLVGSKVKIYLKHMDLELWSKDLLADREKLLKLYEGANKIDCKRDFKLLELKKIIKEKVESPKNNDNKKVIVFTVYSDTAEYIYKSLEGWVSNELGLNIALITGSGTNRSTYKINSSKYTDQLSYDSILTNFSPISKNRSEMPNMPQEGEIDILIATDCISEGQNLQDCDFLINYDIHWNPVRIIQRFGRIDRIGSFNERIQLVNFWPTEDLNNYIGLLDRVKSRMALMNISTTGEDDVLENGQDIDMNDLEYRAKQLIRLKDEIIDLEDFNENISLTDFNLSDFRIDLLNYLNQNKENLDRSPLGMYAVVPAIKGVYSHMGNYTSKELKYEHVIKSGVIYCIKRSNSDEETMKYNVIEPYYLVYVQDDNTVKLGYSDVKQILEVYRTLCIGKKEPFNKLCEIFNKDTDECSKMDKYFKLLEVGIKEISGENIKENLQALTKGRGAKLFNKSRRITGLKDFELVSFLVIL